ncbi:bifunctional UDP-sugar hydrolase/5'-nucleotidase [Pseudorhodoplanes sp.]|uniref:bifunctional metallophosphatase/5'-nucleotidase n=1 Tax=Pseudorhodoplanes sp. TaxID=1934341 RepID=UPI002CA5FD17|nr:bifunctional UDP-sugar hydrolase/5'-nucleotidase [Pseudorhodoplanes sp.]HWV53542.1 bifunctional UDP-sugar hydrolase/5'-nucleotidase [Pseudorhodoplanes sp.]
MKMSITRRLLLLGSSALALVAGLPRLSSALGTRARVTFVLVSDIYLMSDQPAPDGQLRGGYARLASVVKAERAKGGNVLFVHAGDALSPSLMSSLDQGEHVITLTNMLAPDIFVPGNHEFDFGKELFFKRMSEAKFPLYVANILNPDGKLIPGFRERNIIEMSGIRIGITAATDEDAASLSSPGDLKFPRSVDTIEKQAALLRKEGADVVVAVVHTDRAKDEAMIRTRAADIILSGHDHDLWINYDERTAAAESSYDAHFVTCVDITFTVRMNEGRREVSWYPEFRPIDTRNVVPDAEIDAVVQQYESKLSKHLDVPIATTAAELDSRNPTVRTQEAAIGDLIADSMRAETNADIAITNGGGIRGGRIYPPGTTITRRDMMAELPFRNTIALLEISGRAIRAGLENGFSALPRAAGRFPQVSGLNIVVDASRPVGQRLVSVLADGKPLEDAKIYRLATNDFMARGGDGYEAFNNVTEIIAPHDGPLMINELIKYLEKIKSIRTVVDGRIVFR